jgi:pimeloyl-ACP methyl ester carboxylesterase
MTNYKRHYEILSRLKDHPTFTYGGYIQYKTFKYEGKTVLYIHGTNERRDWGINALYFGAFFHAGYATTAIRFKHFIGDEENIILVGHSFGAGTASILYWLLGKKVEEMILIGCPPSYTWLNPLVPLRCTNYRVEGDLVTHANIIRPFFRQCRKPILLPRQSNDVIVNHSVESYIKGIGINI